MGNDPRRSVVNAFCQSHDIPNLFVVDGSVFPSASEKNPTLTIMALALRMARHLAGPQAASPVVAPAVHPLAATGPPQNLAGAGAAAVATGIALRRAVRRAEAPATSPTPEGPSGARTPR